MLALPIVCGFVVVRPEGFVTLYEVFRRRIEIPGGYFREFKRYGQRFLLIAAFDLVGLHLSSRAAISDFNISLTHKLFLEDGFSVLLPATIFYALTSLVMFALPIDGKTIMPSR